MTPEYILGARIPSLTKKIFANQPKLLCDTCVHSLSEVVTIPKPKDMSWKRQSTKPDKIELNEYLGILLQIYKTYKEQNKGDYFVPLPSEVPVHERSKLTNLIPFIALRETEEHRKRIKLQQHQLQQQLENENELPNNESTLENVDEPEDEITLQNVGKQSLSSDSPHPSDQQRVNEALESVFSILQSPNNQVEESPLSLKSTNSAQKNSSPTMSISKGTQSPITAAQPLKETMIESVLSEMDNQTEGDNMSVKLISLNIQSTPQQHLTEEALDARIVSNTNFVTGDSSVEQDVKVEDVINLSLSNYHEISGNESPVSHISLPKHASDVNSDESFNSTPPLHAYSPRFRKLSASDTSLNLDSDWDHGFSTRFSSLMEHYVDELQNQEEDAVEAIEGEESSSHSFHLGNVTFPNPQHSPVQNCSPTEKQNVITENVNYDSEEDDKDSSNSYASNTEEDGEDSNDVYASNSGEDEDNISENGSSFPISKRIEQLTIDHNSHPLPSLTNKNSPVVTQTAQRIQVEEKPKLNFDKEEFKRQMIAQMKKLEVVLRKHGLQTSEKLHSVMDMEEDKGTHNPSKDGWVDIDELSDLSSVGEADERHPRDPESYSEYQQSEEPHDNPLHKQ